MTLHRHPFRAMGCEMLAILEQDVDTSPAILEQIPDWFETWEQVLSRFRIDSELSRLNRTSDQHMPVSQTLWDVFQACKEADRVTSGLVTPTVLDAVITAGYDRPFDEFPSSRDYPVSQGFFAGQPYLDTWTEIRPLSLVVSDETERTICLPQGIRLDLGGVAKGWVAHQTVERLKTNGPALMNAGGDIAISGPRIGNEPWRIGISNPFDPQEDLFMLHLNGGGVATSGKDRRRWIRGDILQHHVIDPRTGQPAETDVLTATVVAPTVMEAEAAAKSVLILGSGAGMEWLEADSGLAGLLILEDGRVLTNLRMEEYL